VQLFARPAVGYAELFVHGSRLFAVGVYGQVMQTLA
jgi:hypothetical protein